MRLRQGFERNDPARVSGRQKLLCKCSGVGSNIEDEINAKKAKKLRELRIKMSPVSHSQVKQTRGHRCSAEALE